MSVRLLRALVEITNLVFFERFSAYEIRIAVHRHVTVLKVTFIKNFVKVAVLVLALIRCIRMYLDI